MYAIWVGVNNCLSAIFENIVLPCWCRKNVQLKECVSMSSSIP